MGGSFTLFLPDRTSVMDATNQTMSVQIAASSGRNRQDFLFGDDVQFSLQTIRARGGKVTQSGGVNTTNLNGAINWPAGQWHEIAVSYDANSSSLYIDGVPSAEGAGIAQIPSAAVRAQGFRLGSDVSGGNRANGEFDN
jgi:hypothetical protein